MHSNDFFNLIACVLFPTPLIPSMAISIPRMVNKW
ncbi:pA118R [African swine fever virus]